jgi:hypothetical protein
MKIYRTTRGLLMEDHSQFHSLSIGMDDLVRSSDALSLIPSVQNPTAVAAPQPDEILAPIG